MGDKSKMIKSVVLKGHQDLFDKSSDELRKMLLDAKAFYQMLEMEGMNFHEWQGLLVVGTHKTTGEYERFRLTNVKEVAEEVESVTKLRKAVQADFQEMFNFFKENSKKLSPVPKERVDMIKKIVKKYGLEEK